MPNDPDHQSPPDAFADRESTSQFVGFQLDDQRYAFRIEQIQEIVIPDLVTPVPQVADFVEGVSNLRGAIIPIVNLRKLLDLPPRPVDAETRVIVVNVGTRTMGCVVDMVSQVIRMPQQSIQPAPVTLTTTGTDYIEGFAKLSDRLVIVLDIEKLLDVDKLPLHR